MNCVIAVESWQMQCCGNPFRIGENVEWFVCKYEETSVITGCFLEYIYEAHGSDWQGIFKITGAVAGIKALFCSYEQRPSPYKNGAVVNYPVYERAIDVEYADGWDAAVDGLEFNCYELTYSPRLKPGDSGVKQC